MMTASLLTVMATVATVMAEARVVMVWVPDSALNANTNSTLNALAPLAKNRSFNAIGCVQTLL